MGSLSQAKTLGGVGAILTLLLFVPNGIGAVLVIVGWVLILIALKQVSDALQDRSIFNNAIVSVVLSIAGVAVFAFVVASAVFGFIGLGALSSGSPPPVTSDVIGLIAGIVVGLFVVWILAIISSYFLYRTFKTVSSKVSVGLFGTGALIFFIGSILTIVLIGFVLMFVAQIIFIIAFFSLPDNPPGTIQQGQGMGSSMAPPPPPARATKR